MVQSKPEKKKKTKTGSWFQNGEEMQHPQVILIRATAVEGKGLLASGG